MQLNHRPAQYYNNQDYHLTSTSPCIDTGNPDMDGDGEEYTTDIDDQDNDSLDVQEQNESDVHYNEHQDYHIPQPQYQSRFQYEDLINVRFRVILN